MFKVGTGVVTKESGVEGLFGHQGKTAAGEDQSIANKDHQHGQQNVLVDSSDGVRYTTRPKLFSQRCVVSVGERQLSQATFRFFI